jgi:anaerobic selenocysteine-containing dehydrogenase
MENGQARTLRLVCPHDCPDTCGMLVTVENGRATKLRGDPDHPFTRGFLCQKVSRYLDRVYHAERLRYPMERIGPKGAGQFRRITWDEAIQRIGAKFAEIAASPDGPEAILPYSYAGTMGKLQGSSLDRRFFHRLGASLLDRTICATAGAAGCDITLGTRAAIDPEAIVQARYIINWGSNTSVTNMHLWALMHQARKAGAKIVTIDPFRCKTAARSDWWVPIRPGTDAALALGMMHVLWRDGLQDDDYLSRYCVGGEPLRARALEEYPPDTVAGITGIPTADIERLAREYGTTRPACIRLNYGLQRHYGGGMAVRTITCLPAITGDWRYAGGGALLSTSKMYPFNAAALERPDLIPPGTRTINMVQLSEALNGELPGPPVQALYVYNSNPAAVCPDQTRMLQGLARDDLFTVVHERFMTDTARYADIVLPAASSLETSDVYRAYGQYCIQRARPAIPPVGESRSNWDAFALLARAMGFDDLYFRRSAEEMIDRLLTIPAPMREGIDLASFEAGKGVELPLAAVAPRTFRTPSGRIEILNPREEEPLPRYLPTHEEEGELPLRLMTAPTMFALNASFYEQEELRAKQKGMLLMMNPGEAAARGLADGDPIVAFNELGEVEFILSVSDRVPPGVAVAEGVWWSAYAPGDRTVNALTSQRLTDRGNGSTFYDTRIDVEAVKQLNS